MAATTATMEPNRSLKRQAAAKATNTKNNSHLQRRYTKTKVIGRGTYGTVYKGIDNETGETVAIKIIDLDSTEDDINDIMKEIVALRECDSKYVTQYFHSFNIGPELWIVMEYLGGGSVHDLLDAKHQIGLDDEALIATILREVVAGLNYLHSLNKIHRDIKAANILLTSSGAVKLADFGVVGELSDTMDKRMTLIGSPYWMAPEVIMQDDGYDALADVWSLGITAIEIAMGVPPYSHLPPYPAMLKITQQDPPNVPESKFSAEFRDFIRQCLTKNVNARPRVGELLSHPFLAKSQKVATLVPLISAAQSALMSDEESREWSRTPSHENEDHFAEDEKMDFARLVSNGVKTTTKRMSRRLSRREMSVEWTFGSRCTEMRTPLPPTHEEEDRYSTELGNAFGSTLHVMEKQKSGLSHRGSRVYNDSLDNYDHFNGGTFMRSPPERGGAQRSYDMERVEDEEDEEGSVEFDGGTMVRSGDVGAAFKDFKELAKGTSRSPDDDHDRMHHEFAAYGSDGEYDMPDVNGPGMGRKMSTLSVDSFDGNMSYRKIRKSLGGMQMSIPKPKLKDMCSVVSYSIGTQTEHTEVFGKGVQTESKEDGHKREETETMSDLVGVYKDIDDLFNVVAGHVAQGGQASLEELRDKVKKLTHMKITERKQAKHENSNSIKIARDRIQQIRQRRAENKRKHSKSAPPEAASPEGHHG